MKRANVAGPVFLVIAVLLFAIALHPTIISGMKESVLFGLLTVILVASGVYQLLTARGRALKISVQLADASPFRRLWLPGSYYTTKNLFWQFRLMGALTMLAALMTAISAFLAYRHGW